MIGRPHPERGATALFVAAALTVLLGMAAVAIDVGAGFNERRQSQTAADMGVMAGALEVSLLGSKDDMVDQVLAHVRGNLRTTYSDAEWQSLWQGCTDSGRTASFVPQPDPWTAGGTLDCISMNASFLRVRVPDQIVETTFGRVLGVTELQTHAVAVALLGGGGKYRGLLPFGVAGGLDSGEICLGQSPSGTAYAPCDGPSSGTFGTILSEFFGHFYDAGQGICGNPGNTEIEWGVALGGDHLIYPWADGTGAPGAPHPGDATVLGHPTTYRDECDAVGGEAVAVDDVPVNTVLVDTGFSNSNAIQAGLFSENSYLGELSRLQQGSNPKRPVVERRTGSSEVIWHLDNVGPWEYLLNGAASVDPTCDPATYPASMTEYEKADRFELCLAAHGPADGVIFDDAIAQSPRFAWSPQYWYDLPTTGLSWEPVHQYRMIFVGGGWFNCNASGTCDVIFYPDSDHTSELCDPGGGSNCQAMSLNQLSGWLLPDTALSDEVRNSFPGGQTPWVPSLYR